VNDPALDEGDKRLVGQEIQQKINNLESLQHGRARDNLAAKVRIECESAASKFWSKAGKALKPPRDTIIDIELRRLESPPEAPSYYETRSDKMIARD